MPLRGVACGVSGDLIDDGLDECFAIDGFGGVVITADAEASFSIASHCMCSQRDDWAAVPLLSEQARQFIAIHLGHLHIGENEIEREC